MRILRNALRRSKYCCQEPKANTRRLILVPQGSSAHLIERRLLKSQHLLVQLAAQVRDGLEGVDLAR